MKNVSGANSWAKHYDKNSAIQARNFYPENYVTRVFLSKSPIQFLTGDYQGKSILDIGCGHGRHIPFLQQCGLNVTGLEVSEQQVEKLKQDFNSQAFVCGLASDIPCPSSSFDFILASNSIYYLTSEKEQISSHFAECARVLKQDGRLIFTMLGERHSIFKGADMKLSSNRIRIEQDFLGFRNGVDIYVYREGCEQEIMPDFEVLHHGEIVETVDDTCRHMHYFVAQKCSK